MIHGIKEVPPTQKESGVQATQEDNSEDESKHEEPARNIYKTRQPVVSDPCKAFLRRWKPIDKRGAGNEEDIKELVAYHPISFDVMEKYPGLK